MMSRATHLWRMLLLSVLALTPCACRVGEPERTVTPADSAASAVPFEMAGRGGVALIVPVHINGSGPHDFVLDTGATLTCLDRALADSLDLPDAGGLGGIQVSPAGRGSAELVQVDSLRVGAARAFEMEACVLDLSSLQVAGLEMQGLLGLNFLSSFRVVLDFEQQVVRFQ